MKAHESVKWGVHVVGPDTVLAAHDFKQAVEKANEINNGILLAIDSGSFSTEYHPIVFAKVFIWNPTYYGGHNPDITDWNDIA